MANFYTDEDEHEGEGQAELVDLAYESEMLTPQGELKEHLDQTRNEFESERNLAKFEVKANARFELKQQIDMRRLSVNITDATITGNGNVT